MSGLCIKLPGGPADNDEHPPTGSGGQPLQAPSGSAREVLNHWTYYPCSTHFKTLEVVGGKIWTNAILVNKIIIMKEALMYMYTVKEILVDHRFLELDQGKNLLLTFVYCVPIVNAMNQFCNSLFKN